MLSIKYKFICKFIEDIVQLCKLKKGGGKIGCGFCNNRQKSSLLDEPPRVPHAYLITLSLKQAIIDAMFKFENSFVNNFSVPSITRPISGRTERPITMVPARMASTYRKQSWKPTGKHPSPRSASVWRLDNNSGSSLSTRQRSLCIHWSLTGNTVPPYWVVTRGRRWLVRKPLCSKTATGKGSML